jgi:hypothetical protein
MRRASLFLSFALLAIAAPAEAQRLKPQIAVPQPLQTPWAEYKALQGSEATIARSAKVFIMKRLSDGKSDPMTVAREEALKAFKKATPKAAAVLLIDAGNGFGEEADELSDAASALRKNVTDLRAAAKVCLAGKPMPKPVVHQIVHAHEKITTKKTLYRGVEYAQPMTIEPCTGEDTKKAVELDAQAKSLEDAAPQVTLLANEARTAFHRVRGVIENYR